MFTRANDAATVTLSLFSLCLLPALYLLCHLSQGIGRIPLAEATLIEEPNEQFHLVVEDGGECCLCSPWIDRLSLPITFQMANSVKGLSYPVTCLLQVLQHLYIDRQLRASPAAVLSSLQAPSRPLLPLIKITLNLTLKLFGTAKRVAHAPSTSSRRVCKRRPHGYQTFHR